MPLRLECLGDSAGDRRRELELGAMVLNAENRADFKVLLALSKMQVEAREKRKDEETNGRQGLGRSFSLLFSHLQDQPNKHQTFQNDMTTYDETETATEPTLGRPLTKLASVEIKKKSQSLSTTAPFGCDTQSTITLSRGSSVPSATLSRTMDGFSEKRHNNIDARLAKRQPPPDSAGWTQKRSLYIRDGVTEFSTTGLLV
ncbi:hypothetical protein CSPX01_07558 [Colletotrichum filicis]|nr:hypothetical protein CSPX01_07558 [Colletotrichum filicis]